MQMPLTAMSCAWTVFATASDESLGDEAQPHFRPVRLIVMAADL
jgi:hypothetical protein